MNDFHAPPLTATLDNPASVPYFLWDEPLPLADFRKRLTDSNPEVRARYRAKLLREARPGDVWKFLTPEEVARDFDALKPRLGRRREFWEFVFDGWRAHGLLRTP